MAGKVLRTIPFVLKFRFYSRIGTVPSYRRRCSYQWSEPAQVRGIQSIKAFR